MTFQYLSPIFTAIIAVFFLGEKIKPIQWLFYFFAFAGVLFIAQVDTRVSFFYMLLGIVSAFGSGAAYNLVRKLKDDEHPLTIILHFQIVGVVAGFISLFLCGRRQSDSTGCICYDRDFFAARTDFFDQRSEPRKSRERRNYPLFGFDLRHLDRLDFLRRSAEPFFAVWNAFRGDRCRGEHFIRQKNQTHRRNSDNGRLKKYNE